MNALSRPQPGSPGEFIALAREAADLTTQDLADRTKLALQTVQRWERDETRPQKHNHPAVARALGITVEELRAGIRTVPVRRRMGPAESQPQATVHHLHTATFDDSEGGTSAPSDGSGPGPDNADSPSADRSGPNATVGDTSRAALAGDESDMPSEAEAARRAFFDAVIEGGIRDGYGSSPEWVASTYATARSLGIEWDPQELTRHNPGDGTD